MGGGEGFVRVSFGTVAALQQTASKHLHTLLLTAQHQQLQGGGGGETSDLGDV